MALQEPNKPTPMDLSIRGMRNVMAEVDVHHARIEAAGEAVQEDHEACQLAHRQEVTNLMRENERLRNELAVLRGNHQP